MRKRRLAIPAALLLMISQLLLFAAAAPSIEDLHTGTPDQVVVKDLDGTNTAEILTQEGVFISQAVASQYMQTNASGETVETELSRMITASESILQETGGNGQGVVDEIPTVTKLLEYLQPDQPVENGEMEFDLNQLDQLTYMMDLKYLTTGYRVRTGVQTSVNGKAVYLEDGRIQATLEGGEVIRAGSIDDYVILLINPHTNVPVFLRMKEYNSSTGEYTVEFPFTGPFMVTQIMK